MSQYDERKDQIIDDIVAGLSDGVPLRELCRREGMPSWRTVYSWMDADEGIATRVAQAREIGFEAIAEEILDIADDASNDWMERKRQNGTVDIVLDSDHVQRSKLRIETRLKLLACWNPKKYGTKQTVDVGNKDGETLKTDVNVDTVALTQQLAEALRNQKAAK
jgi:hypothetical protein